MENYFLAMRRKKRLARKRKIIGALKEIAGTFVFFGMMTAFLWLCMASSGYHWE